MCLHFIDYRSFHSSCYFDGTIQLVPFREHPLCLLKTTHHQNDKQRINKENKTINKVNNKGQNDGKIKLRGTDKICVFLQSVWSFNSCVLIISFFYFQFERSRFTVMGKLMEGSPDKRVQVKYPHSGFYGQKALKFSGSVDLFSSGTYLLQMVGSVRV